MAECSSEITRQVWVNVLFLIFVLLITQCSAAPSMCSQRVQNCTVSCSETDIGLLCPVVEDLNLYVLEVKVKPSKDIKLICSNNGQVKYEWMTGFLLGSAQELLIEKCQLPSKPINHFLTQLGIRDITRLFIDGSLNTVELSDNYFKNLENVTLLSLRQNELKDPPADVFQGFTSLTHLDLRKNNLTLSNDFLAPLVKLKRLELGENSIKEIKPGIFQNLNNLIFLNIWGNKLTKLTKTMFIGLDNLTSLDISQNSILDISNDTFADLKALKVISLGKNNFTALPANLFTETTALEVMKLQESNALERVPPGFLANLTSLTEVVMSRCKIRELPEDIFWGSINISKIDLSRNKLISLPGLLFRDAANLKELDIQNNELTTIPSNIFGPLVMLEVLQMNNNHLTTIAKELFSTSRNLRELHISNNSLNEIETEAFHEVINLKEINLSHNHLKLEKQPRDFFGIWSPFTKCVQLEVIDLSYNNLQEIFADWPITLQKLRKLDLNHNNITRLEASDLQFSSSNKLLVNLEYNQIKAINLRDLELLAVHSHFEAPPAEVKLQENNIQCDCHIYPLLRYLKKQMNQVTYKMVKLDVGNLTCAGPPGIAGSQLQSISIEQFTCPANELNCTAKCKCLRIPHERAAIVNCTAAGLLNVPDNLLTSRYKGPIYVLLDNNNLNSLPANVLTNYTNITKLSLSHNQISWIDEHALPTTLKDLKLDHNNLTVVNSSLLEAWTNRTNLTLHNNPWSCECEPHTRDFLNFVQSSFKQVELLNSVTCEDGRPLTHLTVEDICPLMKIIIIGISSTIAVIGIFLGIMAALYFRFQKEVKVWLYAHKMCMWFVREKEIDKDKVYDAFVSYSHQDEDFVTTRLIPELENGTPSFKLCVHYRDWIAGEFITTQITRSVEASRRTIVVLSENFIKSEWGKLEFRAAHKQALTDKLARVIVIVYGDLGPLENLDSELSTYLTTNTYVKWGDPWFWDKLRYALPHPPKIPKKQLKGMTDKLELIHSHQPSKATTPPTDVAKNPLEIINNFSSKSSKKNTNETNGHINGIFKV